MGRSSSRTLGYLAVAGALALATAAARVFERVDAPEPTIVMTYLLAVVVVAGGFGRGPALASALTGVLLYNVLFTTPYYTVVVDDAAHLYTFAMMLVVAVAVGELTARIRGRLELARERERRFEALYRASQRLAGVAGLLPLAGAAEEVVAEMLPGEVRLFLPGATGLAPALERDPPARPGLREAAQRVLSDGQVAVDGTGSGGGAVCVPLAVPGRVVGALGWAPSPGRPPLRAEGRRLLETLATLVALAVERDRLSDERHRMQAEAEAEKLRSGLLSGLSHDLRTPLAAITGSAGALLQADEPDPATRRALAQTIQVEGTRLARFVEKVLQMTRIHAGRLQVEAEWQPLDEVIGSALHRMEQALGAREVRLAVPSPAPLVAMDGLLIEQVLVNLLENAVSYSPPETPIEVGAASAGEEVRVWVADRGPGVAAGDRERVFQMFFRGPVPGQARSQGVGLGLAICQAIVRAHGGAITVAAAPGGGARFTFTLPRGGTPPALEPPSGPSLPAGPRLTPGAGGSPAPAR